MVEEFVFVSYYPVDFSHVTWKVAELIKITAVLFFLCYNLKTCHI